MSFDLTSYLAEKRKCIDSNLKLYFKNNRFDNQSPLQDAMFYSLMAGGKRLRPVLCIASAESVGGTQNHVLNVACSLEMIHTYSLIHDDLPGMDNDEFRRGKLTCHKQFDEATAILAGDGLLTAAFQILGHEEMNSEIHASVLIKIIKIISEAAGFKGMIEGQMRDILSEGKTITLDELKNIHLLKTGNMIEASVISGAILGKASSNEIDNLRKYANNIGLAFQVTDDILNVTGDSSVMGKAVGTDELLQKATYPALLGLSQSIKYSQDLISEALISLEDFNYKAEPLRAIARYIIERKR